MFESEMQNRGQQAVNIAEVFLHQSTRLIESQAATARAVMRTQARTLAALGGPDLSSLYAPENERQFAEFLKTSADQTVQLMRQTNEAMRQLQQIFTQLVGQQTGQLTAQIRASTDQIGQRTQQAQQEVKQQVLDAAQQTVQQARNAAEQLQGTGADERARTKRPA